MESLGEAGGEGPTLSQSSSEKGEEQAPSLETQSQERDESLLGVPLEREDKWSRRYPSFKRDQIAALRKGVGG